MSTTVSFNNSSFVIPSIGEEDWGGVTKVDGFLTTVANNALSKYGGVFSLVTEVDFGASAGIKCLSYKSSGINVSTSGVLRLSNAESIGWRNAANSADLLLTVNASDILLFNSIAIPTPTSTVTFTNKKLQDSTCPFVDNVDATKEFKVECSGITTATTRTWTVPDSSDTFVGLSATQTLTNKTLSGNIATNLVSGAATVTLPVVTGTLATLAGTEVLTNKTITGSTAVNLVSGAATITLPVVTGTLATLAGTEVLTNKTISGSVATNLVSGAATITLPTVTGTLATLAGTEVLTNKTLSGNTATNFVSGAATITLPTVTGTLATLAGTEVLTNKTLTGNTAVTLLSGAATITLPVVTGTLATLAGTEVLTNKTLTGNTAVNLLSGAATITLPVVTGTLATLAGTEVLTNKDIDGGTASNSLRFTLPKDTIANLNALNRKEGTLVYASDTNALYADNGATLDLISSSSTSFNGFKNRIINGGMDIDQRNEGSPLNNPVSRLFSVDRFSITGSIASKFKATRTPSAIETGYAVRVAAGFPNYLELESLSAYPLGANEFYLLQQVITSNNFSDMAFGTASAQTVTLSFLVNSSLTGNFGGALINEGGNRSYPFSYAVNSIDTWETKTITIPGDTVGTWNMTGGTGIGACVRFSMGASGTFTGTVNTWGTANAMGPSSGITQHVNTSGAKLRITGVQLEKGSSATAFDFRPRQIEYNLCIYYYEKSYQLGTAIASNTTAGMNWSTSNDIQNFRDFGNVRFITAMRTTPSIGIYSAGANPAVIAGTLWNQSSGQVQGNSLVNLASSKGYAVACANNAMNTNNAFGWHHTADAEH